MKYFDTRTGALVDFEEHRYAIENRLAQRYPIVPVDGRVLELIEAGREAVGIEDNDLGALDSIIDRPPAIETPEEAQAAVEAEAEQARRAQIANAAVTGGTAPVATPVGDVAEREVARREDAGEESFAGPGAENAVKPPQGEAPAGAPTVDLGTAPVPPGAQEAPGGETPSGEQPDRTDPRTADVPDLSPKEPQDGEEGAGAPSEAELGSEEWAKRQDA